MRKAEPWRTDAFELLCWRRLLRVPWTARISNQSILKEISPEYSFEGLMLNWSSNTLATCCEELTHWKRPWCWERLKAGEGDDRRWGGRMPSLTWWTWVWAGSGSWWWTGKPSVLQSMGSQRVGHDWATELNWIILHNHTIVLKVFRATGWTEKARQGCFLMWNCYHSEVYCVVFLLWLNFIFYFRLDLLMSTLRLFL